jgi:hypothetical protein
VACVEFDIDALVVVEDNALAVQPQQLGELPDNDALRDSDAWRIRLIIHNDIVDLFRDDKRVE